MSALRLVYAPLDSLVSAEKNPKRHHADIEASLARFGIVDSIGIVDERTGRLVGGHGRVEALRAMRARGAPPPAGVEVVDGGTWRVPVMYGWASANDAEATACLVALNELSTAGGWHAQGLGEVLKSIGAERAKGIGFDSRFLAKLFERNAAEDDDAKPPPENPADVWVQEGATYALGPHRLFVGDSLTPEGRAALFGPVREVDCVLTDPPYAVFGSSTGIGRDIADDAMIVPFFESFFRAVSERLKWTGHLYAFTDWRSWGALWQALKRVPVLVPKNGLVWDKGGSGLGSNYSMTYELALFVHKLEPDRAMSQGGKGIRTVHMPNVFRENRPTGAQRLHNAAKPVKLLETWLGNSTDAGQWVWDPFCGSGSTMIAAHQTGRRCLTGEKSPTVAQVAIERWQRLAGAKAERVA